MAGTRGRLLLGWAVVALGLGAAACDTPTMVRAPARPGAPGALVAIAVDTPAHVNMYSDSFNRCVTTGCDGVGTTTITEPGGSTAPMRTLGDPAKKTITIGSDTYVFEVAIWDIVNSSHGDFMGIIRKNGTFVGYWGMCALDGGHNDWYTTTDPATGKKLIHWRNYGGIRADTGKVYHYIYDPATNLIKVYYKGPNETTGRLIYQGPPIKHVSNMPPPDPGPGHAPYTSESDYDTTLATGTGSGGTTSGTSPGTTGGTGTPPGAGTTNATAGSAMLSRGRVLAGAAP
jgi:hypothetical protein